MGLVTTAGSNSADAYCSLAEATAYFATRMHATSWAALTEANQEAAIKWATRLLDDLMDWSGQKANRDQALRWPRGFVYDPDGFSVDGTTIPTFLKNATAEFARYLAADDRLDDSDLGYSEIKLGSLALKIDKRDRRSLMPSSVWHAIKHYGNRSTGGPLTLQRV